MHTAPVWYPTAQANLPLAPGPIELVQLGGVGSIPALGLTSTPCSQLRR